ncbi:hypothetical protein [Primorskyibacter sp. S187A]|uniref:hypothetical protein n=1 Tax=Primorskyibacter sp. S187A TaxID=3415130 RepID=UPI003C7B6C74
MTGMVASADGALQPPGIDLELNATQAQDAGCLLSFVVQNGHETDLERVVFEAVLFDTAGQVHQLTLFDFGALPAARPRVRQFVVPQLACSDLSRIIFNGASTCDGQDIAPDLCTQGLTLRSRTATELLG